MFSVYPATTFNVSITYPSTTYPAPTYTTGTTTEQTNGWAFFTSNVLLHRPDWSRGSGRPAILACHGGNGTANGTLGSSDYLRFLADSGYVIVAADLGGLSNANNLAMTAMDMAYSYVCGITGGTTVGLLGYSAGGLAALSWLYKWPSRVKATYLLNPFLDPDTSRGTSDWITPYSVQSGDPNFSLFSGGSTPDPTVSNGSFKVTDDTGYLANAVSYGRNPNRHPEDYAAFPIRIGKAQMDDTVPYQQDVWWVGAVDSPSVTSRIVTCSTASHGVATLLGGGANDTATLAANGLPRSDLRDFFSEYL